MAATYTTLQIANELGTSVVDLGDGTNFALIEEGWGPQVAVLRDSIVGGQEPYTEEDEELEIDILGSTGATLLANAQSLMQLLDQAERWRRGEYVDPVYLKVLPQGSNNTILMSLITGGRVELPDNWPDLLWGNQIDAAKIRLTRRGWWLQALDSASSVSVTSSQLMSFTFANHPRNSPCRIYVRGVPPAATSVPVLPSLLITAPSSTLLKIVPVSDASVTGGTTTPSTPTLGLATNPKTTASSTIDVTMPAGIQFDRRRVGVYAMVYAPSDQAATVNASAVAYGASMDLPPRTLQLVQGCQPIPIGIFSSESGIGTISFTVFGATSGALEIDHLVIVALDDERSNILPIDKLPRNSFGLPAAVTQINMFAGYRHAGAYQPKYGVSLEGILVAGGTPRRPVNYRGNPVILQRGTAMAGVWMAGGLTTWRVPNTSSGAQSLTVSADRWRSYLMPE